MVSGSLHPSFVQLKFWISKSFEFGPAELDINYELALIEFVIISYCNGECCGPRCDARYLSYEDPE